MNAEAIKQVSTKLKNLPDSLLEEVEKYIDFLVYKNAEETEEIPQWHKDEVLLRIKAIEKNPDLLMSEDEFWAAMENES